MIDDKGLVSVASLRGVMTQREFRDYCKDMTTEQINECIQKICVDKVYAGCYDFNFRLKENIVMNGQPSGSMEYLCQNLLVRNLNKNILTAYRLRSANRHVIIQQILQLLKSDNVHVMRKDIHHFFESIQPTMVVSQLREEGKVTMQTIDLLEKLLAETSRMGISGLPRGLSISSGLSEYLMRKYDYEFVRMEGMLFYCRFVDDMLFVCTPNTDLANVQQKVDKALEHLHLQENEVKKETVKSHSLKTGHAFDFLGYQFKFDKRNLIVEIAENKIKKIKTKVVIAFKQYVKNGNGDLLYERMRYLTCICTVPGPKLRKIEIGTPANYFAINGSEGLKELDTFYRGLLFCKRGGFGKKLNMLLQKDFEMKKKLQAISFSDSFMKRRTFKVSPKKIHEINECWR